MGFAIITENPENIRPNVTYCGIIYALFFHISRGLDCLSSSKERKLVLMKSSVRRKVLFKRAVAVILCLMLLLSLAACGGAGTVESKILCRSCSKEVSEESNFCPHCGATISNICPNCKAIVSADSAYCSHCGTAIAQNGLNSEEPSVEPSPEPENTTSPIDAACSVLFLEVYDKYGDPVATASGFIIGDGKTLVTNYHVIDGAYRIVATTPDSKKSVDVYTVLGYDEVADLAVLLCDENIGVTPLSLGNSDNVKQGDSVYAVGYPLGVAHTISDGIVGSRYIDENGVDILQVTAAISGGSSGGALLDKSGNVIGVICASYINGQNMNVAIACNVLNDLLKTSNNHLNLSTIYDESANPKPISEILANPQKYNDQYVYIKGYLSSAFAYTAGTSCVDYFFVSDIDDVLGYNYSNKLYDTNSFISFMREENQRNWNGGSICIEVDWTDKLNVRLGDFVVIYGKIRYTPGFSLVKLSDWILVD